MVFLIEKHIRLIGEDDTFTEVNTALNDLRKQRPLGLNKVTVALVLEQEPNRRLRSWGGGINNSELFERDIEFDDGIGVYQKKQKKKIPETQMKIEETAGDKTFP